MSDNSELCKLQDIISELRKLQVIIDDLADKVLDRDARIAVLEAARAALAPEQDK